MLNFKITHLHTNKEKNTKINVQMKGTIISESWRGRKVNIISSTITRTKKMNNQTFVVIEYTKQNRNRKNLIKSFENWEYLLWIVTKKKNLLWKKLGMTENIARKWEHIIRRFFYKYIEFYQYFEKQTEEITPHFLILFNNYIWNSFSWIIVKVIKFYKTNGVKKTNS